jgi:hypothetical protein
MKRGRRPTRRKPSRQPRKRLLPTSTDKLPSLDWLTVEQPTPPRPRARNPALMSSGVVQPPSPPRQVSNAVLDPIGTPEGPLTTRSATAAIQAHMKAEGTLRADATVVRAASHNHAGGLLADILPGPVTWYAMSYTCGPSDGRLAVRRRREVERDQVHL